MNETSTQDARAQGAQCFRALKKLEEDLTNYYSISKTFYHDPKFIIKVYFPLFNMTNLTIDQICRGAKNLSTHLLIDCDEPLVVEAFDTLADYHKNLKDYNRSVGSHRRDPTDILKDMIPGKKEEMLRIKGELNLLTLGKEEDITTRARILDEDIKLVYPTLLKMQEAGINLNEETIGISFEDIQKLR